MGINPTKQRFNNNAVQSAATEPAVINEPNSSYQETPIHPENGINPDLAKKNRDAMEEMANAEETQSSDSNSNRTNDSKDPFTLVEGDHLGNMVKRFRKTFHKAGSSIMWGASGIGALLYLGLGWRRMGLGIAGAGLGAGYLLKNKIANAGLKTDPQKELIKQIKSSKLPKEYQLAMLEMVKGAYKSQNQNMISPENVKNQFDNTLNKVREVVSNLSKAPEANPETAPA